MISCRRACVVCAILGFSALTTVPVRSQTPPPPAAQEKPKPAPAQPPKPPNPFENVPVAPAPGQPNAPTQSPPPQQPKQPEQPKMEAPKPAPQVVKPQAGDVVEAIEFRGSRRVPQDTLRALIS